ncbi:helix-turn-helix domain-containing protein [Streptomyces sp. NPDC051582]|uniref:helix-turn-helix domain-containing protein n=1 Tax=Streptomyces sp. NPDC051582 TaxID=3155167 RepID=UPI003424741D
MSNLLAQHGQLSLLALGAGLHIQSLPEGTPVSIRALAERFPETEYRIGLALNELEAAGFLRRTRLRTAEGKVVTRTVSYNLPLSAAPPEPDPDPDPPPRPDPSGPAPDPVPSGPAPDPDPEPPAPRAERPAPHQDCAPGPGPDQDPEPPVRRLLPEPAPPGPAPVPPGAQAPAPGEPVPQSRAAVAPGLRQEAASLLAGLRVREPRLLLSERDVERLAPAVVEWLDRGAAPEAVRRALTADVPSDLRNPAGLLAYRLRAALPPPLPVPDRAPVGTPPPDRPRHPFRTCDGCERAFRSPTPDTHCGDCRARGATAQPKAA